MKCKRLLQRLIGIVRQFKFATRGLHKARAEIDAKYTLSSFFKMWYVRNILWPLLQKIEAALRRIEDGSYGYCEETDEPITLARLEARPIATLSLEAQERHERMERTHRDD